MLYGFKLWYRIHLQIDYYCRLDCLWKNKFKKEHEQFETMENVNRLLLENVLPAHVAAYFIGEKRNEVCLVSTIWMTVKYEWQCDTTSGQQAHRTLQYFASSLYPKNFVNLICYLDRLRKHKLLVSVSEICLSELIVQLWGRVNLANI